MKAPFSRTFFDLACEQAQRMPDAIAVIAGARTVSYAALHQRARAVAAALRALGLRKGDRLGLLMSNRMEWIELCFGAAGAGVTLVPFSTWSTRQELEFLLKDSNVRALVAMSRFGDRDYAADLAALLPDLARGAACGGFPNLSRVVLIDAPSTDGFERYEDVFAVRPAEEDLPPGIASGADDDGLILYTSGSIANPKAVRLKHCGIIENGFNIGERMGLSAADRVLLSPPLFWSYGSANALPATITHGGTLVLQEKFDPAVAIDLVERHGCTAIYTLPGMTAAILGHPGFTRERVRTLRTGLTIGAPQDFMKAAEGLGASELCNIYGATETYGNCCVTWHYWPIAKRAVTQGPPLPGNVFRFVDVETGAVLGAGEAGLAEVRGYVTPGYAGASSDQNEKVFTQDGYYHTGDVGRLDEDGAFVFVGRNTEMIKRAGINVSPAEVENVLLLHPGVAQVGVVGAPDLDRGEVVVAFVVPRSDSVTSQELLEHCKSMVSKYKVPDRIEIRPGLPLTPTGKLQRRELKQDAASLMTTGVTHG